MFNIIGLKKLRYNGDKYIINFYYIYLKFNFIYTIKNKDKAIILSIIYKTHHLIKIQFY
jgi:hypothetical protein